MQGALAAPSARIRPPPGPSGAGGTLGICGGGGGPGTSGDPGDHTQACLGHPPGPAPTHLLLAGQRCVPGEEERARLLVQRDEHRPVGGPGLGPAHEADDALVPQAGLGRTEGPFLVHQPQDLVRVGEPLARPAHTDPGLPKAGRCGGGGRDTGPWIAVTGFLELSTNPLSKPQLTLVTQRVQCSFTDTVRLLLHPVAT